MSENFCIIMILDGFFFKVPLHTEVLIHKVQVTSYVVKFFHGHRDLKVGVFKSVFYAEYKNRVHSGDQALIFELYPTFCSHFSQKLQKTVKIHQNSLKLKAWSPE